ncbi:MAG: hypothetical protein V4634_15990 [Pseudomonadota bacterium]
MRSIRQSLTYALIPIAASLGCATASSKQTGNSPKDSQPTSSPNIHHFVTSKTVIPVDKAPMKKIAWSPDGKYFAVNSGLQVTLYDVGSHQVVRRLQYKHSGSSGGDISFSPDGKYLAAGNGIITLWDTTTWRFVRDIDGPYARGKFISEGAETFSFSPDSKAIAVHYESVLIPENLRADTAEQQEALSKLSGVSFSGFINAYDINTATQIFSVKIESTYESASIFTANLIYTPDGKYLVSARKDFATSPRRKLTGEPFRYLTYMDFRDARTGKIMRSIGPVHVMGITAMAVSPDGRFILTGTKTLSSENHRNEQTGKWDPIIDNRDPIRLWDVASGQLVKEFGPLRGAVVALSFSPGGQYFASCQTDIENRETLWFWDVKNGQLIERVKTPNSPSEFFGCAVSPDGRFAAMPVTDRIYLIGIQP